MAHSNTKKRSSWWLVLAFILPLYGCTPLKPQTAAMDYRLEPDVANISRFHRHDGILRIERPQANAGVSSRRIAYRLAPYQLQFYTKSRWSDAPTRMIRASLTDAFNASGLFTAAIEGNHLSADYLLTSQLLRLEQQLSADEQPAVRLQLRYQLIVLPERRLLASGVISTHAPSPSRDAPGAVTAANAALTELLEQLVQAAAEALPEP